jgi:ATP-dependent RNA helicase DDX51/DBP6
VFLSSPTFSWASFNPRFSLVCSDLISRGIDISSVSHVVSYDVPVDMRKYVHRVGRTARAGRAGDAWTLVEGQEVRFHR